MPNAYFSILHLRFYFTFAPVVERFELIATTEKNAKARFSPAFIFNYYHNEDCCNPHNMNV